MTVSKPKDLIYAISLLTGTIIGVGFFSLPYIGYKAGFFVLLAYFLILVPLIILIHLIFGEIVCVCGSRKRFPGYVRDILGKNWNWLATPNAFLGLGGSMLAYILISGYFLSNIFSSIVSLSMFSWSLIFFFFGALAIYFGTKVVEKTELLMVVGIIVLMILFLIYSLSKINVQNYFTFDLQQTFLPYGLIIYSLWGASILPEANEAVNGDRQKYRKAIIASQLISVAVYLIFTIGVLGIAGQSVTEDGISGLKGLVSPYIIIGGSLFGFLAIFTSFISLGLTFKKVLMYDFKISEKISGITAIGIPLVLFLVLPATFLGVVSLIGAVGLGIDSILIFLMYLKIKTLGANHRLLYVSLPKSFIYSLIGIFLLGVIIEIIHII